MNKIKKLTVQNWIPIEKVFDDGIIKLKNNKFVKIIKVIPINFNLKSDLEKKAILNSYKLFLKTCNFNMQILIQSNKEDLSKHFFNIEKNIHKKENKYLRSIAENYIENLKNKNLERKSSTKNFYIILSNQKSLSSEDLNSLEIIQNELKDNYFKIKECLSRCGNSVEEIYEKSNLTACSENLTIYAPAGSIFEDLANEVGINFQAE